MLLHQENIQAPAAFQLTMVAVIDCCFQVELVNFLLIWHLLQPQTCGLGAFSWSNNTPFVSFPGRFDFFIFFRNCLSKVDSFKVMDYSPIWMFLRRNNAVSFRPCKQEVNWLYACRSFAAISIISLYNELFIVSPCMSYTKWQA